jgi:hypothetical protein
MKPRRQGLWCGELEKFEWDGLDGGRYIMQGKSKDGELEIDAL